MSAPAWQSPEPGLEDDARLVAAVREVHETLFRDCFASDPLVNSGLGVQSRAFRRLDEWRMLVMLTPWMLARLLFPLRAPDLTIPDGWASWERRGREYQVLGPATEVRLLDQPLKVHLNYHERLGHYLLHPLCLNMQGYRGAEEVFEAWNQVIRIRDANMERLERDCPLQQEISRRELFRLYRE